MEQFHLGFDIDTKPLANAKQAAQDAAASIGKLGDAEQKLGQQSTIAADQHKKFTDELKRAPRPLEAVVATEASMGALTPPAGGFGRFGGAMGSSLVQFAAVGAAIGVVGKQVWDTSMALAEAQDKFALMEGRMKGALGSTYAAKESMQSLYEATQKTGLGFSTAADGFLRLARNADGLGATRAEIQQLSDVVQKLGVISGASRGEIASGSLQLSQALASGKLNGDELRSIMENMPAITKALAENLGVSVGQIRAMGAAGELTGGKVFGALLASSQKVDQQFAELPSTTEREFQKVADGWEVLLKKMGEAWDASKLMQKVAKGIQSMLPSTVADTVNITMVENLRKQIALTYGAGNFDQAQGNKQAEPMLRRLAAMEAQLKKDYADAQEATRKEEAVIGNKVLVQADPFVQETRDKATEIKQLNEQLQAVETGLVRLRVKQMGGAALDEADTKRVKEYTEAQIILQKKLQDAQGPVSLLARDLGRLNAQYSAAGGGGAIGLLQQAQKLSDDMRGTYGQNVSPSSVMGNLIQQEVTKGQDQIRNLEMQAVAQFKLANAVGGTREEMINLEIANDLAIKRFQMFGDLQSPVIDGFFVRLSDAMYAQKKAADEAAASNQKFANSLTQNTAIGQIGVIGNDYQQRRVAAMIKADEAERKNPGKGLKVSEMATFETGEDLTRAKALDAIQRQVDLESQRRKLGTLSTEEYRVQSALLERKVALEQQGLDVDDTRYVNAMRLTEQLVRQQIEFEKVRKQVEAVESVIDGMGSTFKSTFVDSMTDAFKQGKFDAASFFQSIGDMAVRAGNEMVYEIAVKPIVMLLANAAKAGISQYLGTSPTGVGQVNGDAGITAGPTMGWNGMAFDKGVRAFASGGIVDKPTYFAFANGGSVGLMGEAGTEAIMPLKRGPDGKLGVSGSGGGGDVQVIVNDMRGGKDAAPVETKTTMGANGLRQIQILVRDEIRRSMAAGDFDRTMQTNFGANRQIARM